MRKRTRILAMGLFAVLSVRLCGQDIVPAGLLQDLNITNTWLYTAEQVDEQIARREGEFDSFTTSSAQPDNHANIYRIVFTPQSVGMEQDDAITGFSVWSTLGSFPTVRTNLVAKLLDSHSNVLAVSYPTNFPIATGVEVGFQFRRSCKLSSDESYSIGFFTNDTVKTFVGIVLWAGTSNVIPYCISRTNEDGEEAKQIWLPKLKVNYYTPSSGGGGGGDGGVQMEDVEWAGLTNRVAKGILAPGRQYRITDYETKSSQGQTSVTNKPYIVIATALSTNELSEVACAAHRTDNTALAGDKVEAWKLWYSLYNDEDRFLWADTTSGKGVVYRMIDEHYNDIPYDFKCIKFSNSEFTLPDRAYGVVIKPTFNSNGKQILNGIVISNSCQNVTIEGGNMNLTLAYTNTFNSATDFIQNITVGKGVYTDSTRKTIYVPDKNQAYETEFRAPDSLVISVE